MANERIVKITIAGDASGAQKALKAVEDSSTQAQVKLEGFGQSFVAMGAKLGLGAQAVGAVVNVMHEAIGAVGDYNSAIDTATKTLLGQTKSQQATAAALAVARAEADKGRGTYQELAGAMAGLATVAKTAGLSLASVTETAEILAAINPEEGIKGATFALREAASGDMTSVIERFNLSRTTINKLRAEGVPAIEAVRRAMAELGYDTKFLDTANQASAKQLEIAKGKFTELAAIVGKPFFDTFIQGVTAATKATEGPGGVSFAQRLATELDLILHAFDGRVFEQLGVDVGKTFYLIGDAFNNLLKSVSGGKLNIDGPLREFYNSIVGAEKEVAAATKRGVAQPAADQLSGQAADSPLAPSKVQGYGAAVLAEYVKGLTSGQISDFQQFTNQFADLFKGADGKQDTQAFAEAQSLLAQALKEVARDGQISETTLYRLTTTFGKNADEVIALTVAYGRMGAAQQHATATANALATAQQNLAGIQAQARNAAADADRAIAQQQATATQHAQDAADAIEAQQDALKGVGAAAAESARRSQDAIDGLQRTLADAQAAQQAATDQRRRDSEIAQAAINGTTEAYERQNDTLTEQDRKLAQHYETIIGGERRAKDAADERVNGLNRAANKEDLDFLTRIRAAREQGHAKEANALQRQFDARKKARAGDLEIARAQQAVAGDEYDARVKQIDKEKDGRDEIDARNEKAAAARVAAIQTDIKGVQDAAKAEAERYAAQQRGIQAEIDRLTDAAKTQARKDADALTALQNQKTETALRWSIEEKGATVALGLANQIVTANQGTATAAQETYNWLVKQLPYAQGVAAALQTAANARAVLPSAPSATGGGRDERVTPEQVSGAPLAGPPSNPGGPSTGPGTSTDAWLADNGQRGWGPAIPNASPPGGYHTETRPTGVWWVRDGWTLNAEGTGFAQAAPGPAPTPGGSGGSDSLGRAGSSSLLAEAPAPAGGGDIHLHINAPNLTDIGNPAQQRALAAQSGAALRYWRDKERSGPPQGVA